MKQKLIQIWFFFFIFTLFTLSFYQLALAQSKEELKILRLFYKEEDLVVTPSRSPKPMSQVADNITIITSKEIERMHAHTVADILKFIPGVQVDASGGPGAANFVFIQGCDFTHVVLMIDGIVMNSLSDGFADFAAFPVQPIDRIEIIKGPASSSWGSSLGGIIHLITKSTGTMEKAEETLYGSLGEGRIKDYGVEAFDGEKNFGYYFYTGCLESNGLNPNTAYDGHNLYTKLQWDINQKADVKFNFGYNQGKRGLGEFRRSNRGLDDFESLFSSLNLYYSINHRADLTFALKCLQLKNKFYIIDTLYPDPEYLKNETKYGATGKFHCRFGMSNLVLGVDLEAAEEKSNAINLGKGQVVNKWGVFINNTIGFDKLSIIPGIRYDHTDKNGIFTSPSLGFTYNLAKGILLRGSAARGFNIPTLSSTSGEGEYLLANPDLRVEKVSSYQVGLESDKLKNFWIKTSLFRHIVKDAIGAEDIGPYISKSVNKEEERRDGLEIEMKTSPFYNFSFSAGYTLIEAKNLNTDERSNDTPKSTFDTQIQYCYKTFQALLIGHYIQWNPHPSIKGKDDDMVWDVYISKQITTSSRKIILFLNLHNIFNGNQYLHEDHENPKRWLEGGIRYKF